MGDREELAALRRLAELEDKAAGAATPLPAVGNNVVSFARSSPQNMAQALESSPGAGIAETALSLGSGTAGQISGGLAGIGQGLKNLIVPGGMSAADRVRQIQGAMTYQPQSAPGQAIASGLDATLGQIPRVADWAGGKLADVFGPLAGTVANTAIQAAPSLIGMGARSPIASATAASEAAANRATALAAPKTAAIQTGKAAGFVMSPAEANPTLLNRIAEGFSGQSKVQKLISQKNQPQTNAIARQETTLSPDTPLSVDALETVRKAAGQVFEDVRNIGRIPLDSEYGAALNKIEAKYQGASKSFPDEPSAVENAVASARKTVIPGEFDSSAAVDKIKVERAKADVAFRQGNSELGKAHKAIADAIEGQIERHLQANGLPESTITEARQLIAKTYDVQKALVGNDISAAALAGQLKKGRPISGGLKQIAEFAQQFPGAVQLPGKNAYVPSLWETLGLGGVGGLGGLGIHLATGGGMALPAVAAAIAGAARPVARSVLASKPYQAMAVNPPIFTPNRALLAANALTGNPAILNALALAASQQQQK